VVDIFRIGIQYIVVLLLLLENKFSIELLVFSNIIWVLLIALLEVLFFRKNSFPASIKNHEALKKLIKQGFKILPHYASIFGLMLLDKILIKEWATDAILAQYAIGFMIGQLVILFTDAFNKVWGPYAIKTIESGKRKFLIKRSKQLATIVVLINPIVSISVFFLSSYYFPEHYELAQTVAAIVSFVFVFQVIYFLVFPFLVHANAVGEMGKISTLSTLLGGGVMLIFAYNHLFVFLPFGVLIVILGQITGMIGVLRKVKFYNVF